MKASKEFLKKIKNHLDEFAQKDELFAKSYANPNKNIEECSTYILGEVFKNQIAGCDDDEVYNMAIHYYDEDNIEIYPLPSVTTRVVVNHHIEKPKKEVTPQVYKPKINTSKAVEKKENKQLTIFDAM